MKEVVHSTFKQIKKRKVFVIGILLLQMVLFLSIFLSGITFQILGINEASQVIEPIQNSDVSPDNIDAVNQLTKGFDLITKSYKAMWKYMRYSIYIPFAIFVLLDGIIWALTHSLRRKTNFGNKWLHFAGINLVVFLPYFLLADWYISSVFTTNIDVNNFVRNLWIIGYLFIPLYYLAVSGFALVNKSWKEIVQTVYNKAIKKFYITLPVATVLHLLIAGSGYILFFTLDKEIPSLIEVFAAGGLFMVILLITRLIWINYIENA